MILPNFIIGGAPKSATSSVFAYLSEHPEVCGSSVKETNFLIKRYSGVAADDRAKYSECFSHCSGEAKVVMEATPGYLVRGEIVAERLKSLCPEAKVLFILREPAERLYSHYNYNLHVLSSFEADVSMDEYIRDCMSYSATGVAPEGGRIRKKTLVDIDTGKYSVHLKEFFARFAPDSIRIMFYEDIKADARAFMGELCRYLGIDSSFYDGYTFNKVNVTTVGRSRGLHKAVNKLGKKMEFVTKRSHGKSGLLGGLYKAVNEKRAPAIRRCQKMCAPGSPTSTAPIIES